MIAFVLCTSHLIFCLGFSGKWGVVELIQHHKSLLTEDVKSQVSGMKCKGLKPALSPSPPVYGSWDSRWCAPRWRPWDLTSYISIQTSQLLLNISPYACWITLMIFAYTNWRLCFRRENNRYIFFHLLVLPRIFMTLCQYFTQLVISNKLVYFLFLFL